MSRAHALTHSSRPVVAKSSVADFASGMSRLARINLALCAAIIALVAGFIFQANSGASNKYHVKALEDRLAVISEENALLTSRKTEIEDAGFLAEFAESRGMVQNKQTTALFGQGDVALGR